MARPYPIELRERVLAACDGGMKTKAVAQLFSVSPAWVRRLKQRRRETGEIDARPTGGATVVKIDLQRLRQLVAEQPDATTRELHRRLGAPCCESAVGHALTRLRLSYKKRRSTRPSRNAPTSPPPARHGRRSSRNRA